MYGSQSPRSNCDVDDDDDDDDVLVQMGRCRCPSMTSQDKLLHCIFLMSLLVMAACLMIMATVFVVDRY